MEPRPIDFMGAAILALVLVGLVVILFVGAIPPTEA